MPSAGNVAERAVGLPWLRPGPAAVAALTADPPDAAGVAADPAAVAHVLRYCRPTATPFQHPFSPAGLSQPAICGTAADLLEHVTAAHPPPSILTDFIRQTASVAGELACAEGADARLTAAVAGLVPLGWLAACAVEPISSAEIRFQLATPDRQQERWGLDAVGIGRRLAARWRLPEWVTATVGLIRLHPNDAVRAGAPAGLFELVQRAVAAVESDRLRLGLTDANPAAHPRLSEDIAVSRGCRLGGDPLDAMPVWAETRLLRAVTAARRKSAAVWQAEADDRADRLADSLAKLRTDWDAELRQAKLAGLAEFAAGASHEINNPLGVIAGHARLLLKREDDPERRKQLSAILRQTDRVHDLLRGTLQFARPPAARPGFCRLAPALADCVAAVQAEADERGVSIELQVPDTATAAADADHLGRMVSQLLRNAVDATPDGGQVTVEAVPAGGSVLVHVSDSGPGPSPAVVPHLFDPFFSGKSAGRGRGLGLSIAWRLAGQNGGDLRFDPTPAEPSRFTLTLPAALSVRRSA